MTAGAAAGSIGAVFAPVVGQPAVVEMLAVAAAGGASLTHAWLITGPPGSGRSVAARAFAAALQCSLLPPGCGKCPACRAVRADTHADVTVVAPQGLSLGVDAVRALVREAARPPLTGRHRVILVTDADRLTESAGNALLKPLEEPGAQTVFLLCAPSAEDLPATVRSRCRLVILRQPSSAEVAALLVDEGADPAIAAFAAAAAQGHVGRARRLARDQDARQRRAEVLALPTRLASVAGALTAAADVLAAATADADAVDRARAEAEVAQVRASFGAASGSRGAAARAAAAVLRELERSHKSRSTRTQRDGLDQALTDLAGFYRDVLVRQFGAAVPPVHPDQSAPVAQIAAATTPESTLARLDAVLDARAALATNVAPALALEALALQLR